MAITSEDIANQSFSIERKGYDVDEVDVFLEQVASSVDEMNKEIELLRSELLRAQAGGADTAIPSITVPPVAEPSVVRVVDEEALSAKDAIIASKDAIITDLQNTIASLKQHADASTKEILTKNASLAEYDTKLSSLERELADRKADGNAIAQALIIAQRSADEVVANANNQAIQIISDAHAQASEIVSKAVEDKEAILDEINQLEVDREDARNNYLDMLNDFVNDATEKINHLDSTPMPVSAHAKPAETKRAVPKNQIPARRPAANERYVTPAPAAAPVSSPAITEQIPITVAPAPTPAILEKDFSGYGSTPDFTFDVD